MVGGAGRCVVQKYPSTEINSVVGEATLWTVEVIMRLARIRRLGWRWAWHVVLLAFLMPAVCLGAEEDVRVVGPVSCKDMVMELGGEYAREVGDGLPLLPVDYRRSASGASAAGSFVKDRDLMLSWGKVGEDLKGLTRHRWRRLSPEGHVLGARALAVVELTPLCSALPRESATFWTAQIERAECIARSEERKVCV